MNIPPECYQCSWWIIDHYLYIAIRADIISEHVSIILCVGCRIYISRNYLSSLSGYNWYFLLNNILCPVVATYTDKQKFHFCHNVKVDWEFYFFLFSNFTKYGAPYYNMNVRNFHCANSHYPPGNHHASHL